MTIKTSLQFFSDAIASFLISTVKMFSANNFFSWGLRFLHSTFHKDKPIDPQICLEKSYILCSYSCHSKLLCLFVILKRKIVSQIGTRPPYISIPFLSRILSSSSITTHKSSLNKHSSNDGYQNTNLSSSFATYIMNNTKWRRLLIYLFDPRW